MTDEEMDNFVLAVLPKKTAAKMQKELQDLVKKRIMWWICSDIFVVMKVSADVFGNTVFFT